MTELIIIYIIVGLLLMVAPILIGVIVYLDAIKRKVSSPLVWALIAALVPFYLGLLIYVLVGVKQTDSGQQS